MTTLPTTPQDFTSLTPVVVGDNKTGFASGAHAVAPLFSQVTDAVRVEATTIPQGLTSRQGVLVTGASSSTFRARPGDDVLRFVAAAYPVTGIAVALQNTFISGNRGNDTIHIEATGGKTRLWGRQAVVFGGAGDDVITAVGAAVNSYVQMGIGNDRLSIGQHTYDNPALRWNEKNGNSKAYGIIRGGNGMDTLHFQHLSKDQFMATYTAHGCGYFTLGTDPTQYMEFETLAFNDGQSMATPVA